MTQASSEARQAIWQSKQQLPKPLSTIRRYGLAVLFVSMALGGALLLQRFHFRDTEVPLFLFALAVAAWYGARQASLLNLTHDTIFVRDMSDVITYWNRGAQELYGWTTEQAIGKRAHELLQSVFPVPIEEIRAELLRSGRWDGELKKTRADGTQVIVASRWSLQRDEQGRPTVILETNNDLTERERREQEIRSLNEELEKRTGELEASNKELEAFAYSISHDLRAPLRHMAGFSQLLQKNAAELLNDRSQRYVMMILESVQRMGNLIDDLLAFSRIGRAETHKTMVSLGQQYFNGSARVRLLKALALGWLPFSVLSSDMEAKPGRRVCRIKAQPFIFHFRDRRSLTDERLGTYPVG